MTGLFAYPGEEDIGNNGETPGDATFRTVPTLRCFNDDNSCLRNNGKFALDGCSCSVSTKRHLESLPSCQ